MRVLVGKTFGIGNCVLCVPLIKALSEIADVDILVGSGPNDVGAYDVMINLVGSHVKTLYVDRVDTSIRYDVAVMAIPFDGRWQNGRDFSAEKVIDGRSRPDPSTFGFSSWKKHETLYQMEDAYDLGYQGQVDSALFRRAPDVLTDRIYLGVGYKKDPAGYWLQKHWGNERYASFIDEVCQLDRRLFFTATGDAGDLERSIFPIKSLLNGGRLMIQPTFGLCAAFDVVGSSGAYVGNDTGMMHVAASFDRSVYAFFGLEGTQVKNYPLCHDYKVNRFNSKNESTPQEHAERFVSWYRSST